MKKLTVYPLLITLSRLSAPLVSVEDLTEVTDQ